MKTGTEKGSGIGVQVPGCRPGRAGFKRRASAGLGSGLGLAPLALLAAVASPARAADLCWNVNNGNWSTLSSWSTAYSGGSTPGAAPGASDSALFSGSGTTADVTATLTGPTSVGGIQVLTANARAVTIAGAGQTLTLGAGGIVSQSFGSQTNWKKFTLSSSVTLAASQGWYFNFARGNNSTVKLSVSGSLQGSAATGASQTLLIDEDYQSSSISGVVSDGSGGGTLGLWLSAGDASLPMSLANANSHSGGTAIQGNVNLNNTGALGSGPLRLAGGTVNFNVAGSTFTPSSVVMLGGKTTPKGASIYDLGVISRLAGGGLLYGDSATLANLRLTGQSLTNGIIGPWAMIQAAANQPRYLTLSGVNVVAATYTSVANADGMTDPTAIYSNNGGTLTGNRSAYAMFITGLGSVNLGNFDLTLCGITTSSWTPSFYTSGTGRMVIGNGELILAPANGGITISANIASGTGHLTVAPIGSGNVTLSGANAHTGGTSLHGNTLYINGASALGTGTFTISGGAIDNNSAADVTMTANNPQVWNTDFTFTGTRSLNMGTGAVSLGSYPGATRTVKVDASTFTIGGAIANGMHGDYPVAGLTKTGAGTLALTGTSTYSGATTLSAGTLALGASASLGSPAITVAAGATLQLAGSASLADTATLTLNGVANPAGGVKERVGALYLGGVAQADKKTYGSTASAAMVKSDTYFTPGSTGVIEVGVVPASGTAVLVR